MLVDESHVAVRNFANSMELLMRPHIQTYMASRTHKKRIRVAVLISGSETNLQVKYYNFYL